MRNKEELVQYIIWGILSSILNIGLFQVLMILRIDYRVANGITLVVVKVFSYITNKLFVFKTPYNSIYFLLKEISSFFLARGVTFILDFVGVMLLVEFFHWRAFWSKCFISTIVIILNYILSKKIVFFQE